MTTVIYKKSSAGYLCRELYSEKGNGLTICVENCRGGEISLINERIKLEKGQAKFNTPLDVDGIFEPILHIGKKNFPLERLCVRGGLVYTDPSYSARSREIEEIITTVKTELSELCERIKLIEKAVFESKFF